MIEATHLRELRDAIENALDDCHAPSNDRLVQALEGALLAIQLELEGLRKRWRDGDKVQIEHTQ